MADISICKFGCSSIDGCQGHCDRFDTLAELHGGRGMTLREIMDDESPAPRSLIPNMDEIVRDAARYRWLRMQHWNDSALCVVAEPKVNARLGSYCPSEEQLDAAIDAFLRGGSGG